MLEITNKNATSGEKPPATPDRRVSRYWGMYGDTGPIAMPTDMTHGPI